MKDDVRLPGEIHSFEMRLESIGGLGAHAAGRSLDDADLALSTQLTHQQFVGIHDLPIRRLLPPGHFLEI